jgi:hypothetical protein
MWTRTTKGFSYQTGILALGAFLFLATGLVAQQPPPQEGPPPPPEQQGQYPAPPQGQESYGAPVPSTLTIPAGTTITGQLTQYLSSHRNHAGDAFAMTLSQPLIVNGWVVARPGQSVNGEVTVADKGGSGKGPSQLGLALTDLSLVDGQQVNINTQLVQWSGPPNAGRNVGTVATTTILGTIIGAAIGRGTGAAIGAGAGAAAGAIAVLKTPGEPTVLVPETTLSFRTGSPITINTAGSERAFLPVSPEDYPAPQARARYNAPPPPPYGRPYPPYPYPYAYGYPYPYSYYYGPGIVIRSYGGWGYYGRRGRR